MRIGNCFSFTTCLAVVAGCSSTMPSQSYAYPMLDGSCSEYEHLSSTQHTLSDEVTLLIYQDNAYVWLCYNYPEGSYGTMNLELQTAALADTLNLHVSAQIGEWPLGDENLAPKNPESNRWWNQRGWMSNPVWINGMERSGEEPSYRFKNDSAREVQLSKSRFGRGEWHLILRINAIKTVDGEYEGIVFPAKDQPYLLIVS